jgi:hypothetical protein
MIPTDAMDSVCMAHENNIIPKTSLSEHCWDRHKGAGRPDSDLKITDNESTQECRFPML